MQNADAHCASAAAANICCPHNFPYRLPGADVDVEFILQL